MKYNGFQTARGGFAANGLNLHRQKRFCKSQKMVQWLSVQWFKGREAARAKFAAHVPREQRGGKLCGAQAADRKNGALSDLSDLSDKSDKRRRGRFCQIETTIRAGVSTAKRT